MDTLSGQQIRERRTELGWTQRRLADMIGVTPGAVSQWENGDKEPSYNHMRRIIEVFNNRGDGGRDRIADLEATVSRQTAELDRLGAVVGELARLVRQGLGVHVEALDSDATPDGRGDGRDDRREHESRP